MKISTFRFSALLLATLLGVAGAALAAPAPATSATGTEADAEPPNSPANDASASDGERDEDDVDLGRHASSKRHHGGKHDDALVNVGADSVLEAGKQADSVVSVFGNARAEGTVREDVVSVFGSTTVGGKIGGDAVAVFGSVELGPHAEIGGDAVSIFGELKRDPAAVIHGETRTVFGRGFVVPEGLRSWIEHCLVYGRPLSLAPGLGWAWGIALFLLGLYVCIALVFRGGVERCVETFERQPGQSILSALLVVLLTPMLLVLLCITVIGIAAVPFAAAGWFCVALFGKTVILAWLGGRVLRLRDGGASCASALWHPALAVLVGGLIATALYLVPFFGFLVYKLLGFLGFGAVVYTAILGLRARQAAHYDDARAYGGASAAAAATVAAADTTAGVENAVGAAVAGEGPADAVGAGAGAAPAVAPVITAALPRAGFWIRMVALLLDLLLVGLTTHLLVHGVGHAFLIVLAGYAAIMWKLRGSTVGGIVFDLAVVRLDGRAMDWETAIIRGLSCFLSLAVAGLGFFWIAFDQGNQAWHDKIAGTVVVRVPKK
jgi:uncharacterized RDD family membrane protein YckC